MVATRTRDYGKSPPKTQPAQLTATGNDRPEEHHVDEHVSYSKFVVFQKLPCELRLMIWEASMTPRLVVVRPRNIVTSGLPYPKHIVPSQLSVNMESRQCGLRRYGLIFTVTLIVDFTGRHSCNSPSFEGTKYRANVVMSPDDTLGLLGWEKLNLGHRYWFRVENANPAKAFGMWPQSLHTRGAEPEVKSVAFLGPEFIQHPNIISVLNSMVSCDVRSLLNGDPARLSRFRPLSGAWSGSDSIKRHMNGRVWIHSSSFKGTLREWGRRLLHRSRHRGLFPWIGPQILAFELGKEPEEFTMPKRLVLGRHRLKNLQGYYLSCEWEWRQTHPCPQGF